IPVFYTFADPAHSWVKPFDLVLLSLSVVLLQGFSRDPVVLFSGNPAAWTLSCEAFFYALHPFFVRLLRDFALRGSLLVSAGSVVVAFGYRLAVHLGPAGWASGVPLPVERVPEFVLGMAIAWAMAHGWRPRLPVSVAWIS